MTGHDKNIVSKSEVLHCRQYVLGLAHYKIVPRKIPTCQSSCWRQQSLHTEKAYHVLASGKNIATKIALSLTMISALVEPEVLCCVHKLRETKDEFA